MDRRSLLQGVIGAAAGMMALKPGTASATSPELTGRLEGIPNILRLFDHKLDVSTASDECVLVDKDPGSIVYIPSFPERCVYTIQKPNRVFSRLHSVEESAYLLPLLLMAAVAETPYLSFSNFLLAESFVNHVTHPANGVVVGRDPSCFYSEEVPESIILGVVSPEKLGTCFWRGNKIALVLHHGGVQKFDFIPGQAI